MKRLLIAVTLSWFVSVARLSAAEPVAYVEAPAAVLDAEAAATKALTAKLADFERATGIKLLLRVQAKSPSAEEDKVPGAVMSAWAAKLGVAERGVLVACFADEGDWRAWIGDELTAKFAGQPGTAKELTENGAIHQVKDALFEAAQAAGDKAFAALQAAAPKDRPPTKADQVRLQAEAVVEAMMAKFRGAADAGKTRAG